MAVSCRAAAAFVLKAFLLIEMRSVAWGILRFGGIGGERGRKIEMRDGACLAFAAGTRSPEAWSYLAHDEKAVTRRSFTVYRPSHRMTTKLLTPGPRFTVHGPRLSVIRSPFTVRHIV